MRRLWKKFARIRGGVPIEFALMAPLLVMPLYGAAVVGIHYFNVMRALDALDRGARLVAVMEAPSEYEIRAAYYPVMDALQLPGLTRGADIALYGAADVAHLWFSLRAPTMIPMVGEVLLSYESDAITPLAD